MYKLYCWLSLVCLYGLLWANRGHGPTAHDMWQNWSDPVLFFVLLIAMWWCHERLGWFGTRQSEAEVPHMSYHPLEDQP